MRSLRLCLYNEATSLQLRLNELAGSNLRLISSTIEARGDFISHHLSSLTEPESASHLQELASDFAFLRVRNAQQRDSFQPPLPLEIDIEHRRLLNNNQGTVGIIYDGFHFQRKLRELLPPQESGRHNLHIIFTNRLLATWEEDDLRYHLRTIILGQPAIISTSGLVEAPAKPREYYFLRQQLPDDELARATLRRQFAGRFLEYDDPRLTEVAKGYLLQAVFYHLFGEAFCPDRDCHLFNAHWQEEMLHAQLRPGAGLCERHKEMWSVQSLARRRFSEGG